MKRKENYLNVCFSQKAIANLLIAYTIIYKRHVDYKSDVSDRTRGIHLHFTGVSLTFWSGFSALIYVTGTLA